MSRRIFPKKKKTLWGTFGNSPAATAPVSSPPCHLSEDCVHLISEGAETTGTTQGRVPSDQECPQQPGTVPIHQGVSAPHFRGSLDYRHHPGEGVP